MRVECRETGRDTRRLPAVTLGASMGRMLAAAAALAIAGGAACEAPAGRKLATIPDGLVVLTFDDGNKSDITFVAPTLKEYGFGASFYVTEGLGYREDPDNLRYLSWDDIRHLHELGFEVGNHTRSHLDMARLAPDRIRSELEYIEQQCQRHGIPKPVTFVYPGWRHGPAVVEALAERQYLFARRGVSPEHPDNGRGARGRAYDPAEDHPLLIPTTGYAGPDWGFEDLEWAVEQATDGRIAVLTFHGVPAVEHPWVHTEPDEFLRYMDYLRDRGCTVIAVRDLIEYVDPTAGPADPYAPIRARMEGGA